MAEQDHFGIVRDYGEGRMAVEDVLDVCRSYEGPAPHFLFSSHNYDTVFSRCLELVPEDKLLVFLEALVAERPDVLTLAHPPGTGGLLSHALMGTTSRGVHLLLSVPQATRLVTSRHSMEPLHVACERHGIHPDVIHRLIDLDADVLSRPAGLKQEVPLHLALERDPASAHVRRMIELRPETLLARDRVGQTPVARAIEGNIWGRHMPPGAASAIRALVEREPKSVAPPPNAAISSRNTLKTACVLHVHCDVPELVRAVLNAHPPSLVLPDGRGWGRPRRLPFQVFSNGVVSFVTEETAHLSLAVVEYVLGLNASALGGDANAEIAAGNVAWFQGHVRDTIQARFPGVSVEKAPGLAVARALLPRSRGIHHNRNENSIVAGLGRAIFCHKNAVRLLRGKAYRLRNVVFCDTVVDLYKLNRLGRYHPIGERQRQAADRDDIESTTTTTARHQIVLLASLKDSETVESTYLQFRGVSHHALLAHGRGGAVVGSPETRSFGTPAVSCDVPPNSAADRRRTYGGAGLGSETPKDDTTNCLRPSKRRSK